LFGAKPDGILFLGKGIQGCPYKKKGKENPGEMAHQPVFGI
jgi:hypothetical protein